MTISPPEMVQKSPWVGYSCIQTVGFPGSQGNDYENSPYPILDDSNTQTLNPRSPKII